jgi:hypothetical protein
MILRAVLATTLMVTPALAVPVPTCEQVREHAKNYTMAQIRAIAKRARLTAEQWAAVKECIGEKK